MSYDVEHAMMPWSVHHHEEMGTVLARSTHEKGDGVGEEYATWHCPGPFTVLMHIIITVKHAYVI